MSWSALGFLQGGPLPYGNYAGCDIWHYFGLSLSPSIGAIVGPEQRYIARPLYFGPVHLLKLAFPSVGVSVLSYFLFTTLTLPAFYLGMRAFFSRTTSTAASLLLGLSPLFLSLESTTYVSVGCLAYTCCMLACLLWAAQAVRPAIANMLYGFAGLFFAFSANANLLSVKFNFLFCLLCLAGHLTVPIDIKHLIVRAASAGAFFIAGTISGIGVVVLVSVLLGLGVAAPYLQVQAAIHGMGDYHYPNWAAETVAFHLVALALTCCGIAVLQVRRGYQASQPTYLFIGIISLTCLFNLHSSLIIGDQNLTFDWFYALLLPSILFAFCFAFDGFISRLSAAGRCLFLLATPAGLVAFNWLVGAHFEIKGWLFNHTQLALHIAFVLLLAVLVLGRLTRPRTILAAMFGVMLILQLATGSEGRKHFFNAYENERSFATLAERSLQFIYANIHEPPVVWAASADHWHYHVPIVRGLLRCFNFKGTFPAELPDPALNEQPPLEAGRILIVLDGKNRTVDDIEAALRPFGYYVTVTAAQHIAVDLEHHITVTIGIVRSLDWMKRERPI